MTAHAKLDRTDGEPILAIRDLSFAFGRRRALDGVSLTIGSGEIFALLGPNGAGKTTLIRTVAGRAIPIAGDVRVCGEDPAASPAARRWIGLVPQQIALYPTLTCSENLRAFGALMGMPRAAARARAEAVLHSVGLADRAGERVHRLSGGMARRLNIGASILHEPHLLVLDEPTVGIDPHARESIHELLLVLRGHGMGMLLTTHDMEQAERLADRVAIITDGVIRIEGRPAALIADAFGGAKEVFVDFAEPPPPSAQATLRGFGLRPRRGANAWAGPLAGGYVELGRLERECLAAGLQPRSIALKQPDLASVFFRNVGRDLDL